jgi:hypothetical protein
VTNAVAHDGKRERRLGLTETDQLAFGACSRREALRADVERLEQVGLSGTVLSHDEHDAGGKLEVEGAIGAVVPKRDAADDQR